MQAWTKREENLTKHTNSSTLNTLLTKQVRLGLLGQRP